MPCLHSPVVATSDERPVRVDACRAREERRRLSLPDSDVDIVGGVHQPLDVFGLEPSTVVSRGRRIRDGPDTDRIEKDASTNPTLFAS